jgi:hypothetical protein
MGLLNLLNKVRRRIERALSSLEYIGQSPGEIAEKKLFKLFKLPENFHIPPPPEDFRIFPCGKRRNWGRVVPFRKRVYFDGFGSDVDPPRNKFRRTYYPRINPIPEETEEELEEYESEEGIIFLASSSVPVDSASDDAAVGTEMVELDWYFVELPVCCYEVERVFV